MSDLGVRLYGIELGEMVALYDGRLLGSLNPAQRRAQTLARERLQRHARRAASLAETDPGLDPQTRAALEALSDLMDLLSQHARAGHDPTPDPSGLRARAPLSAPVQIWAPQPAEAVRPAETLVPEAEPDWNGPIVCGKCGLRLERTELAVSINRPITQGWRHSDSRKSHFPEPVPLATVAHSQSRRADCGALAV